MDLVMSKSTSLAGDAGNSFKAKVALSQNDEAKFKVNFSPLEFSTKDRA